MYFPDYRPRRLRRSEIFRRMIRETHLRTDDLIYPLFVVPGQGVANPISSLAGQFHFSVDRLVEEAAKVRDLGVPAVILFGVPDHKDEVGTSGWEAEGVVQRAIRALKEQVSGLAVITDVCLCEYTSHGHCGLLKDGEVDNDSTLEYLARMALSHVEAGADMVAPSDMMDGRVSEIRSALDEAGHSRIPIMSYAAKYASSFYGPFREAAQSAPAFGDRRGYQMDPANSREAVRETALDVEEGADIVMVKPALPFLDIISLVKSEFDRPVAAYNVSGEYAMIKAAAQNGWLDERAAVLEALTGIKRAGADLIITYHAPDAARWLAE